MRFLRPVQAPLRIASERETTALPRAGPHAGISRSWVVSEATVRTHVHGLVRKLGVRSQLGIVAAPTRCSSFTDAVRGHETV